MAHEQNVAVAAKPKNALKPTHGGVLQRACACGQHTGSGGECAECRKKRLGLQRQAIRESSPATAPPIVHEALRSPGQPLDAGTRAFMEPHFGHDFSRVRVHTGTRAANSAQAVNALAYTVGQEVVFNTDRYQPRTDSGRRLLAHELAHTVQQQGNAEALQRSLPIGAAADAYEREADRAAGSILSKEPHPSVRLSPIHPSVQRACVGGRWQFEYDGCSLPDFVVDMLGIADKDNPAGGSDTQFAFRIGTSAGGVGCDRHDECYQTCNPAGKAACDLRMYTDMVQICLRSSESTAVKARCLGWAQTYYAGLRVGGDLAFAQRQVQVCGCALGIGPSPEPEPTPTPTPVPEPTPTPAAECQPASGDAAGERIRMRVNTADFLTPDDRQRFEAFADTLGASGARVRIHGLASVDGPAEFNRTLSCTRAVRAAELLRSLGIPASQIEGLYQHGEVPGPARENRSVVLETVGGPPGPGPAPGPTPPPAPSCAIPSHCPAEFCQPFSSWEEAIAARTLLTNILLAGIAAKVSPRVVPLWSQYLYGGSTPQNFNGRFGADFANSATTADTTDFLVEELRANVESNPPTFPAGVDTVTVDLRTRIGGAIDAINVPEGANEMNFDVIGEIPGNIAGGIGSSQASCPAGARPSPFNDERRAAGMATITRNPDGTLTIVPSITFTVRDTIDLCPGDCGADIEQIATVPMSRMEASGISGDVPFTVEFPAPARRVIARP